MGKFSSDTDVSLSISADGFEAWRQGGCQGWTIIGTILSMPISSRFKTASQLLLTVTPGPREPKDLDSFLQPIMEELNILANGISGLKVHGSDAVNVLRAFLLQFTTDVPAGDMLINTNGSNGISPSRFHSLFGCWSAQNRHYYFPYLHPVTGEVLFTLLNAAAELRTIETITAAVEEIEESRRQKRTKAHVEELCRKAGSKGYSLLLCPSLLLVTSLKKRTRCS